MGDVRVTTGCMSQASGAVIDIKQALETKIEIVRSQAEAISELNWAICKLMAAISKAEKVTICTLKIDQLSLSPSQRKSLDLLLSDVSLLKNSLSTSELVRSNYQEPNHQEEQTASLLS